MLRQAEIPIHLLKKYVDDINLAVGLPEKGSGWARQYYDYKLYLITDYNSNSYYYDLYYYKLYLKHNKVTVRHKTVLAIAYNLWTIIPIQVSSKTITITWYTCQPILYIDLTSITIFGDNWPIIHYSSVTIRIIKDLYSILFTI